MYFAFHEKKRIHIKKCLKHITFQLEADISYKATEFQIQIIGGRCETCLQDVGNERTLSLNAGTPKFGTALHGHVLGLAATPACVVACLQFASSQCGL